MDIKAARSDREHGFIELRKALLEIFAERPVLRVCTARGKSAESAVQRLHAYNQWCKVGSLFRENNYPRGSEWVCKASWTLQAWQTRKLSPEEAKNELIFNRDQVQNSLDKIQAVQVAEIEQWMRSEKAKRVAEIEVPGVLRDFKEYRVVREWQKQYLQSLARQKLTRFKFLVLCGPSRHGKTRFACSLYGISRTYVAQCQGVKQPAMAGYDPRKHQAILLDEPSQELVESCKVFLQAALEGGELYQSPTQRFTRWIWVYGVPIIICTNDWITPEDNSKLAQWIRANQVYLEVSEDMFKADPLQADNDDGLFPPKWFSAKLLRR